MHLAYEWVVVAVMLAESNNVVHRLRLSEQGSLTRQTLKHAYVVPPGVMWFGGRLDADKYFFGFRNEERLCYIDKIDPFAGLTELQAVQKMARNKEKSLIDTNDAYRMATNWLTLLSIEVQRLERAAPPRSEQRIYRDRPGRPQPIPIFDVVWGDPRNPHVNIRIDGRTKETIYIRLEENFSKRQARLLKDRDKLMAIPDEEFLAYSPTEKEKLLE